MSPPHLERREVRPETGNSGTYSSWRAPPRQYYRDARFLPGRYGYCSTSDKRYRIQGASYRLLIHITCSSCNLTLRLLIVSIITYKFQLLNSRAPAPARRVGFFGAKKPTKETFPDVASCGYPPFLVASGLARRVIHDPLARSRIPARTLKGCFPQLLRYSVRHDGFFIPLRRSRAAQ